MKCGKLECKRYAFTTQNINKKVNNAANAQRDMRARVAAATGVPVELLTGDTEEACTAQAQAALKFAKPVNSYPDVRDGGDPYHVPSMDYAAEAFRNDRKHTPRSYPHSIY